MSTILVSGILLEILIIVMGILIIKRLQKNKTRQPELSNKIIKNLKF